MGCAKTMSMWGEGIYGMRRTYGTYTVRVMPVCVVLCVRALPVVAGLAHGDDGREFATRGARGDVGARAIDDDTARVVVAVVVVAAAAVCGFSAEERANRDARGCSRALRCARNRARAQGAH